MVEYLLLIDFASLLDILIDKTISEFVEILLLVEDVDLIRDVFVEFRHLQIGMLAHNEHSDIVVDL